MKVLFVNTSDSYGGAAKATVRIMKGVDSLGVATQMFVKHKGTNNEHVVELSEFVPNNRFYQIINWCAFKVKNKWQHYKWRPYKDKDNLFLSDLRSMSIHGALQKLDYDILHLNWINLRFLDIKELNKVHKPIVWTLHDSWAFCGLCHYFLDCGKYKTHCGNCPYLNSGIMRDLSYEVFEKKSKAYEYINLHIVTPSYWLANCVKESALLKSYPVDVIPNCIDTEVFSSKNKNEALKRWIPKRENNLDKSYILFGAVGAVTDKIKGFSHLISAIKLFEGLRDLKNIELLVFGTNEPIDAISTKMEIHYLGYISNNVDLALLYSLADVVVVPSLTENLSCTIMESLSCETPVCCFDIGGNSDMVEHKKNGYLARKLDDQDLADGIIWCLENNQGGILGKNGRRKVLDCFSVEVVSKQYKELYANILNETHNSNN